MTDSSDDTLLHVEQKRPLLVAGGIAVVVTVLLAALGVDLHRCEVTHEAKSQRSASDAPGEGALDRDLRLWLSAGDLDEGLRTALSDELARAPSGITLSSETTQGGRVTVRVDDASFYTPLYARVRLTAVMDFETGAASGAAHPNAEGDTRLDLEGACYGLVSPSSFRAMLSRAVAKPLAETLIKALE